MAEREDLLTAVAARIADYREGDVPSPSSEHVNTWVSQFDGEAQLPILREMNYVLERTYFSRQKAINFLNGLFQTKDLVGDDPCAFWKKVAFLDIQQGGASQREMLALFDALLKAKCGYSTKECGKNADTFVYIDDAVFTGNRVRRDLENWVANSAPQKATVHVIAMAVHTGTYYAKGKVREAVQASGKELEFKWWRAIELEDRRAYTSVSDVLRPVAIPQDQAVVDYVAAMQHQPHLRTAGNVGGKHIFSTDEGRQLLEREFLIAGVRIRQQSPYLADSQRPLGHSSLETLGFGSMIVTFRNCPNDAPLALWAGDPWYPLFPRSTNSQTALKQLLKALEKDPFDG